MFERVLTRSQEELLAEERRLLGGLRDALTRAEAAREDRETLDGSIRQLDELFLLVVVGEFNSGKSTFVNALLGSRLLAEGVTPTTTRIHRIVWGEEVDRGTGDDGLQRLAAPVELLRQVHIVDTPGTNALDRRHEAITDEFVPRSDLVLFVTSADRPFTESERQFMERIRKWGKKLVLVVNKLDFLRRAEDVDEVRRFVTDNAERLLGLTPRIFLVSAQQALEAKLSGDGAALEASRLPELEGYLAETLDEVERVRLKLLNPLGVGRRLAGDYLEAVDGRVELLQEDLATLDDVERQLGLYREDLGREFRFRLTDVDNLLHEFEKRGLEFFDDTFRLPRALDLLNKAKIKADFERRVIADAPRHIEKKVDEIIDWMVAAELRQWKSVADSLARRRSRHTDRLIGEIGSFDYDRNQLLDTVGRAAQRSFETYDREGEAGRMAESVRGAVAGAALIEVGALGLGAIVTAMATTQLADVTGLLAAGTLALLGFFVLPAKRAAAKRELRSKIVELRERLLGALTEQFDREVERSLQRIREATAPYTRFVRAERERLEEMRAELSGAAAALDGLAQRIEAL